MKPRETGGNVPGAKKRPAKVAPRKPSGKAPAPPRSYTPQSHETGVFGDLLERAHAPKIKHAEGGLTRSDTRKLQKAYRPLRFASKPFPYTNPLQVGYANASGDIERNILPRAVKIPTKPPKVHPGLKRGASGYAYVGKNEIWITPSGYMADPNYTRGVALHELGHTRQHPKTRLPKWAIEGGADYAAEKSAKRIGLPSYRASYPKYLRVVKRQVKKRHSKYDSFFK